MSENLIKCPSCRKEIERNSKFCPKCGAAIPALEATSANTIAIGPPRKQMGRGAKLGYAGIAIGLFALALFTYVKDLPGNRIP